MNTGFSNRDLTGVLPAGLGDLGPALKILDLEGNAITSLPTELGALTGLAYLGLSDNQLTGVPTEFRTFDFWTVNPSNFCDLSGNPGFSCANVGAGTSCCIADNNCGEGLSGGPCYTG